MSYFTHDSLLWLTALFQERFGHEFIFEQAENTVTLSLPNIEGHITFKNLDRSFHQFNSDFGCNEWQAEMEGWQPVAAGGLPAPSSTPLSIPLIDVSEFHAVIHYDILGLTYWMLNRLEEVGCTELDGHSRFSATLSHAFRYGYLDRPVVDEWLHILGQVITRVWPKLILKRHVFNIKLSHDVDRPTRYGFSSPLDVLRSMAGDILKRKNFRSAMQAPWIRCRTRNKLHHLDIFNTFDWIMDVSESNDLKSAFYFISGRTNPRKDADYELNHPAIRDLLRRVHARGHEIGLHPSYNTYQRPDLISQEFQNLKRICSEEGIEQDEWGGRMHYLRWQQPTTLQAWNDAGLNYDSTLSYADRPGFRCGTCFEYTAFNPVAKKILNLRIRPLIVMESSIMSAGYMGLGTSMEALDEFQNLLNACKRVGGCFTLLWHNSEFDTTSKSELYKKLVSR